MDIDVELRELGSGKWMIELSDRPDILGPLSKHELRAIFEALEEWMEYMEY